MGGNLSMLNHIKSDFERAESLNLCTKNHAKAIKIFENMINQEIHNPKINEIREKCPCCNTEIVSDNHDFLLAGLSFVCSHCGEEVMLCSKCNDIFGNLCDQTSEKDCFAKRISSSIAVYHYLQRPVFEENTPF